MSLIETMCRYGVSDKGYTPNTYKSTNPMVEAMKIHIRSFVPVRLASGLKDMFSISPTPE